MKNSTNEPKIYVAVGRFLLAISKFAFISRLQTGLWLSHVVVTRSAKIALMATVATIITTK